MSEPAARPRLLYLVDRGATGWIVRCETQRYGPYRTFDSAMKAAAEEAAAARQAGFASTVLVIGSDRHATPWRNDAATPMDRRPFLPKDGIGH